MQGSGVQLRDIFNCLNGIYPDSVVLSDVIKESGFSKELAVRLLAYAADHEWVKVEGGLSPNLHSGPYRLTGQGIDMLNRWTNKDDGIVV